MNDPDVSPYDTGYHNACDFSNWQAADGAWQLVACIRSTSHPGSTRLFYHWEGKRLTDPMWEPKEIFATSDLKIGYVEGRMPITAKFGWGSYNLFWIPPLPPPRGGGGGKLPPGPKTLKWSTSTYK